MDLLDRLLGHDAWTTRQLLLAARPLGDAKLDLEFDLGHRTLRATFLHLLRNMEVWCDLMAGRDPRPGPPPAGRSIEGMIDRLDLAAADLAALARGVAERDGWDELWLDRLDDPATEKTYGGAIAHVITHSMHHRAQVIAMLRTLGVAEVPEGDVLGWEQDLRRMEQGEAARRTGEP